MTDNTIKKQKCPKCKKHTGLELIYNTPTEEEVERVRQGLAMPGGFMPKRGPVYKWNCKNCMHVWGKLDK
jgi:hypothetical protein